LTEADFLEIEEYLGKSLPPRYRATLRNYPFEATDNNLTRALYPDVETVLSANAEQREGEWADEWGTEWFAIGCSPSGDTYLLDLTGVSSAVFMWDHETHETISQTPDLDGFVAKWKKYEEEARLRREREKPASNRIEREVLMSFCIVGSSILFVIVMILVTLFQARNR